MYNSTAEYFGGSREYSNLNYVPSFQQNSQDQSYNSSDTVISFNTQHFVEATNNYGKGTYLLPTKHNEEFVAEDFLLDDRPRTEFITDENSRKALDATKEVFELITEESFPTNIIIQIVDEATFLTIHPEKDSHSETLGFSINRQGKGLNEIVVKQDNIDRLMLTIGHEVGHVMSKSLPNQVDEEAKAFSFSLAWMEKIVEHNILGLSSCINPNPARNGLHNVAFDFVARLMQTGKNAIDVFKELVLGRVSLEQRLEVIL